MNSIARILAAAFLVLVIAACSPADNSSAPPAPPSPPDPGIEREAVFDAMREGRDQGDLVFVTSVLNIENDWAWVTADPQSKDGTQHYETESWLLHKVNGKWSVAAQPCVEEGCEPQAERAKIRERFPEAPAAIFPTD